MQTVLIVVSALIFVFSISFLITISINYDVFNNSGKLSFYVFKIPIYWLNFTFIGEYLNFSNKKNKVIKIKIDLNDEKLIFFKDVANSLKRKIYFYKISSNILIALENPFIASLLCGEVNIFLCSLYSYLLIKNKDIMINKNVKIGYRHNKILLNFNFSLMVSLYDYLWSYFKAYKQQKRRMYEAKHNI